MSKRRMYWLTVTSAAVVCGLMLGTTVSAAGAIVYEQSPGHFGGFGSDGQPMTVADEFQFEQPVLVQTITWWGGYGGPETPASDSFTLRLFTDNGGQPGTLVQQFDVGNDVQRTATGDFVNPPDPEAGFEGRGEFEYSIVLPAPFAADANTRYWLSIINLPSTDIWLWEASGSLVNLGVQRTMADPVTGPWEPYLDNTAFRLQAAEETQPLKVEINIRPRRFPNKINITGRGRVSVAILSSSAFDAPSQVDSTSLTFGRTGNEASLVRCSPNPRDVNGDGLPDLVCRFDVHTAGFQRGDTVGVLKGTTITGIPFTGMDSVRIVH